MGLQYLGILYALKKKQGKQYNNTSYRSKKQQKETTIKEIKAEVLNKLKRDTSISKQNHIFDVVKNLDPDGIERLYFHIKNMDYGEYHPLQQDCYGTIDKSGLVELYKSREPKYGVPKEAFCEYTDDEKCRIEEIKSIIKIREEEMENETEEWKAKSSMQKFILKMKGKMPKQLEELKDFLSSLPMKFEEIGRYKKSLIVNESSAPTPEPSISELPISQTNSNVKEEEMQI